MSGIANWKAKIELDIKDLQKQLISADEKIDKFANEDRKVKLDVDTKTLESAIQKLDKMLDSLGKGTDDFKQFEHLSKELSSIVSEVQSLSKAFGKVDDSGTKTLLSSIQNIDKSLSELSQNILNVNKNMSNMGVKQIENISNESKKAASALEDVDKAQAKVNGQKTNISSVSTPVIEQQIKSESELNAEIEKRENIIRELQQLQEKLTVHEDFHDNDRYFADQLPTEEEIREADKRIKQLTGTNNIFDVDKLIQDRNEWLSEVKYSLEEYDDLIKANDQKALDEYTTRGLSRIGGAESFFGYEDNNFSIASKFVEEKEKIQNEINDLYVDLDKLDEKMNFDSNNSSVDNTVQSQEKLQSELKETQEQAEKTTQAVKEAASTTASTVQKKDAFPSTEATASVEKTTQAIKEENSALDETVNKAKQAASELAKTRDIISQNWYREKGTVVGKDSKGNDITRDADEFSFVERLKNGQLQTVLATYNEETGKWVEQIVNVRTAFEQVEKAIISADNKIASLEMVRDKTLAAHPGYDVTADQNQIDIEKAKRDELQQTLNLYGQEKEYVFEIEAANKRIADNQERLNNKKQSQTNLRQVVSDEQFLKDWDAAIAENNKRDTKSAKQAKKELNDAWNEAIKVNTALGETKATLSSLSKMPELTSNFSDMKSKISNLNSDLTSDKITLSKYKNEVKSLTSEYSKMVNIQQNRNVEEYTANAEAAKKEVAELQAIAEAKKKARQTERESIQTSVDNALKDQLTAWKNIQSIREKINNTSDTHEIEVLKQVKSEYQQNYIEADKILKANSDLYDKETQLAKLEQIRIEANNKIASSQEKQLSSYENKLSSYQTKKAGYDATIARFKDGGWTSDEYLKNVQAVKDAVKKYEDLLSDIKAKGGIASEEDVQKLKEYEGEIEKTISTVSNMSAAEKGYKFEAGQKELDKIHKLLNENSNMSSEAKAKIRAYYREIESGNPSMSLDKIHGEIMKIYNAEVEAGRAGRSFIDTLKNSGFHQFAAQMAGMFSFYDIVNVIKQAASTVTELNTQITELAKVSEQSSKQIYADFDSYADIAKEVRGTISDTIAATADWAKNGYSIPDAKQLAEVSQLYKNVGDGIDIDAANESLISTLKGFQLEADQAEHIVDVFNEVDLLASCYSNVIALCILMHIDSNYIG